MLRPRWYKVIHDLFGNKTRTLLIVLSMAVGLFAIGIILSARSILSEGLARSFAAITPSSGTVRTIEPFDEDFLQYPTIWAAAGTPNAIFELNTEDLQKMTSGNVVRVK